MNFLKHARRVAALTALGLAGVAQAHTIAAQTAVNNWPIPLGAAATPIPGMTTVLFANPAGARFYVHFAGECAVNAPAGNTTAWADVDIVVLNAAGLPVQVLPPTAGNQGALCAADGSAGTTGWQSNAVIAIGGPGLPAGNYRVQVRARVNNGALAGSTIGERTLLVTR